MQFWFPGFTQWAIARAMEAYLRRAKLAPVTDGSLFEPSSAEGSVYGGWRSARGQGSMAIMTALLLAGVTAGFYFLGKRNLRSSVAKVVRTATH